MSELFGRDELAVRFQRRREPGVNSSEHFWSTFSRGCIRIASWPTLRAGTARRGKRKNNSKFFTPLVPAYFSHLRLRFDLFFCLFRALFRAFR